MSIAEKHIMFMGSSTMAQENSATEIGGPIDESVKVVFEDLTENATLQIVSDTAADSTDLEIIVTGRDVSGALITENIVLDGATAKSSASPLTFERLILASITGAAATGTIALMSSVKLHVGSVQAGGYGQADNASDFLILNGTASGVDDEYQFKVLRTVSGVGRGWVREIVKYDGTLQKAFFRNVPYIASSGPTGTVTGYEISDGMVFDKLGGEAEGPYFHDISVTKVTRPFYNAAAEASGGSEVIFVEKVYALNLHTTLALTSGTIAEQSGGVATDIAFALAATLNEDSTNYGETRSSTGALGVTLSFVESGTENIANSQNLSSGSGQAVWIRLKLAAGAAATNSFYKMQVAGQST